MAMPDDSDDDNDLGVIQDGCNQQAVPYGSDSGANPDYHHLRALPNDDSDSSRDYADSPPFQYDGNLRAIPNDVYSEAFLQAQDSGTDSGLESLEYDWLLCHCDTWT
jgi:hypothetical protein